MTDRRVRHRTRSTGLVALSLGAVAACSGGDDSARDPVVATATTVAPDEANFVLVISNQSFDRPSVFIEVRIDDRVVVAEAFEVEGQHNFVSFGFSLDPGDHELSATAADGTTTAGGFAMPEGSTRYGTLLVWTDDAGTASLDLRFTDEPPGFG